MFPVILAAAAADAALPAAVEQIEVVTRARVAGTLQQGVQAYRSEFFTQVRPSTALDMIQWLPGFTFEDARDVRGLAGASGNVLIDGQPPISKNDTLATVLRRIPSEQVDRVDIIVGGAPGIDMRGRTVVANVVLKKTTAPRGTIIASTQVFRDGQVTPELQATYARKTEGRSREGALTLARRTLSGVGPGTGLLVRRGPLGETLFEANSDIGGTIDFASASAATEFPWAAGKLRVNGSANYQDVVADERAQVIGAAALYSIDIVDHFRQGELGARYERPFGAITVETQVLQRLNRHAQDHETFRPPVLTRIEEEDTLSESVARTAVRWKRDDRLSVEGSAEGAYNRLETDSDFFLDGRRTPVPAEDVTVAERRGELGLLATWKPSMRFSAVGALKLEASGLEANGPDIALQRDLAYLKPRVVLSWTPVEKTQLRLRAEHEVNQISFQNFAASVDSGSGIVRAGNPNLRPRRAWVAEATLERQFWTGGSFVLTVRRLALRDVVDQRPLPGFGAVTTVGNIGNGRDTNVTATLTLPLTRLGLEGMNLKSTATLRNSRVTDPTTGTPRRLSDQPAFSGELHFTHDLPAWKVIWGVDAIYVGSLSQYWPTQIQRIGAQVRVSAFVERRIGRDLNLRVEGFNLNDLHVPWVLDTYAGLRGQAPLRYSEERRLGVGPTLFVRLRKTLGS